MASKRTVKHLFTQLNKLDDQIAERIHQNNYNYGDLIDRKAAAIRAAQAKGLKMVAIQAADGCALYAEIKRGQRLATFEWLYNVDGQMSTWGQVVAVPVAQADRLVKQFDPQAVV
jgi:hypothetical protein